MKLTKISLTVLLSLSLFSCKKKTDKENTTNSNNTKVTTKPNAITKYTTSKTTSATEGGNGKYKKVGNNIYFGTYSQTLETDSSIISNLESKITPFNDPADASSKGWNKQTDYASNATREAYYYRDIDLDDDGTNDYRVIHIYKYKNYNTSQPYDSSSLWYHDKTKYVEGSTYYFKYEEIKWDILEEKDGKAYLYANLALDAYCFEKCTDNKEDKYSHGGKNGYANNYELSSIRKWLNEDFYNLSFNDLQKEIINQSTVKNGSSSVTDENNEFVCSDTNDYVTLLSEKEVVTYFDTEESRIYNNSILNDYAKIQDADFEQVLLRSPDKSYAYNIKFINNQFSHGIISSGSANYALYAIRPVIVITL